MPDIDLRIANREDEARKEEIADIVNKVYDESEGNIWVDDYKRTSKGNILKIIRDRELLIATAGEEFYGCIHLQRVNNNTFKFKMLVANPAHTRKGIGSLLVNFAEEQASKKGATYMQLELLVPTEFVHPDKVFLHNWYTRIGYQKIAEHDVDYVHRGISNFLKTGCVAKVYQKNLIS